VRRAGSAVTGRTRCERAPLTRPVRWG